MSSAMENKMHYLEEIVICEMKKLGLNPTKKEDVIKFWKGKLDD